MSLKRHCDICDKVIYPGDDFHCVSKICGMAGQIFGSDYCICKECWQLLIDTRTNFDTRKKQKDLCVTCKKSDICKLSTKIFSDRRTNKCYKYEKQAMTLEEVIKYCKECISKGRELINKYSEKDTEYDKAMKNQFIGMNEAYSDILEKLREANK